MPVKYVFGFGVVDEEASVEAGGDASGVVLELFVLSLSRLKIVEILFMDPGMLAGSGEC